jgi:hypothetical protein
VNPTDHIGRTQSYWVNRCEDDEVVDEVVYPPAPPVSAWTVKTPVAVKHARRRMTRTTRGVLVGATVAVLVDAGFLWGVIAAFEAAGNIR